MAMTVYLENKMLNSLRGIDIEGFTSNTGDDGSGVEVIGGSYERVQATFSEPIKSGVFSQISNDTEIYFGIITSRNR